MKYLKFVPMALLSAFALKVLALGCSLPELGVMAVLAGYAAFCEKSVNDDYKKHVDEQLLKHTKGFENVDSFIKKLFENDKELSVNIQKLSIPQAVKQNGFGNLRGQG